jgi:hypothetical protein
MKLYVKDFRRREWFLLGDLERDAEDWYLDVNCDQGAVGFSSLVKLSEAEREEYHAAGPAFVEALAARISDRPERYRDRDLTRSLGSDVTAAVLTFKESRPDVEW